MNKKGTKALASATLMSLVLTTALATGNVKAAANGQATRVGGTDRYETAAKVATANFTTSENVVLVSGEGYADSVSASVLAKKLNAPIVLTGSKTLDANAKSAIETLKAKNVYIIGGTGSISASIETGLKSDYTVTRLGGQDRYATNLAIANKLVDLGVSKSNIIAVAGTGFADALSVAPVAAADNEILLLTNNNADTMKNTAEFAKNSNVTVVGTTNVVSDSIYNQLKADKRINGGDTRFETNINVLNAFDKDLKADKLYVANATQANPDNLYADALVASAIAGKYSAPLVLVDKETSTGTTNAINYIGTKATKATDLQVVGGTGVVSDSTVSAIEDAVNPKKDLSINSVDYVNSKKVVINFNKAVDNTDDIEDDGNRVVAYPAGQSLSDFDANDNDDIRSSSISFSNDKKTATVVLNKAITTGKNYKLDLIDTSSDNLDLANSIVSYTGVLSKGIDVPTATVNDDQNNFVITYAQKMKDDALTASNYTVYDSDNNKITTPFDSSKSPSWDDATTKKVVKLPIASGSFKAGETYKVVVDSSVKADDGTALSSSQKVFNVVTPGISDAKPVLKVAQVTGSHTLTLTFSKDLKTGLSIDPDSITVKKSGGTKLKLTSSPTAINGKVLTITTDSSADAFDEGRTYTVSLDANAVKNQTFINAGNDEISNYSVSSADNVAAKTLTGKFVQNKTDSKKYDVVFTFDQPVKPFTAASGDLQINALGHTYNIASGTPVETYTDDSTGKSLVVKDIVNKFSYVNDENVTKYLEMNSTDSYQLLAKKGTIATNTVAGTAKTNTSDLKTTINGVNAGTPDIDTVTLKSSKEIDVKLKNTTDSSALTSSDVKVQGFIKTIGGNVNSTPQTLTGSQINVSASGDTVTITPKDDSVVFATGVADNNDATDAVVIGSETLKNSNKETNGGDLSMKFNSSDLTDEAAPELLGATANGTGALKLTYSEDVNFKGGTPSQQASQFDVTGAEEDATADSASASNNIVTLTFNPSNATPFASGKDYSNAKVGYTSNPNYKIQDADSNDASTITLTGIYNAF
ncbi:cell wall-binding repeat-containing protein [Clostridium tyrobutyricum]|uniref:cell wall-binding repeat-containing protein n=1 Tax=Clostridium tyrobutyricum TaxID=1519 RepID=UPI001C3C2733|nr:cell wall-binding repeat-containing protein [Clostridium tyrobutyricum]MBV4437716.1 cell wall-binding repeat-containing protein [Clostridium tyrobutyricum]